MNKLLIVFLLVTPQMSSPLPYIDSYAVLLFILMIHYTVNSKKMTLHPLYLHLFVYFSILMLIQYIMSDTNHGFSSHTRYISYRENDTYGFSFPSGMFDLTTYIKIILMLALSQLIFKYLSTLPTKELNKFFLSILLFLAGVQLFFYFLNEIHLLDSFLRTFFQQNIRADGSLGSAISSRGGSTRIAGGFSEPSMIAIMYFISLYYYYFVTSILRCHIKFTTLVVILSTWFVVMLTTASTSHLSSLALIIFMFFKIDIKIINYIYLIFFTLLELIFINQTAFVKDIGASAVVRLLLKTDLNTLTTSQFIFGTEIANFYAFIPSTNLILQLGLLGSVIFFIILYRNFRSIIHTTPILLVIFISPRFSDTWIYILFGFMLTSSKLQKDNHNSTLIPQRN